MQQRMLGMLAEVEEAAPTAKWAVLNLPPDLRARDKTACGFTGQAGPWHLIVLSFSIEDQGHPAGSRGYEGTGSKGPIILRLTRALAEKLFRLAEKSGGEPQGHQAV